MFGQGHGFASAMGGSINFSTSHLQGKGNDNDLMLMRGRAGIGNGLGPDAGKRESNFSSLTYRPSPTLAPSFAHSDSMYDLRSASPSTTSEHFVPRQQKRKGKKHRQANASSSGGSGIVDVADPSILRMHHNGANQGSYNTAQSQGGYNSQHMMYSGGFGSRW